MGHVMRKEQRSLYSNEKDSDQKTIKKIQSKEPVEYSKQQKSKTKQMDKALKTQPTDVSVQSDNKKAEIKPVNAVKRELRDPNNNVTPMSSGTLFMKREPCSSVYNNGVGALPSDRFPSQVMSNECYPTLDLLPYVIRNPLTNQCIGVSVWTVEDVEFQAIRLFHVIIPVHIYCGMVKINSTAFLRSLPKFTELRVVDRSIGI